MAGYMGYSEGQIADNLSLHDAKKMVQKMYDKFKVADLSTLDVKYEIKEYNI